MWRWLKERGFIPWGSASDYGGDAYSRTSRRMPAQARAYRTQDALSSSLIAAAVEYKGRELSNIRLVPQRLRRGEWVDVAHPVADLLADPSEHYGLPDLLLATEWDLTVIGDAFWRTERNGRGRPTSFSWLPSLHVRRVPSVWTPGAETGYVYQPPHGAAVRLDATEVIHFRHGISSADPRRGVSKIGTLLEEIGTDEEAARYTISALWNSGAVGLVAVMGPDDDGLYPPAEDLDEVRDYLDERLTGAGRGRTIALQGRIDLKTAGAQPGAMALDILRQIPEQRVAAVLGIPAAVLGFGSGLDATKVGATMREMERQAVRNGVLPEARHIADVLTRQLGVPGLRIGLDTSEVLALQPDMAQQTRLWVDRLAAGIVTRAEARQAFDLDVTPADDVYLMPFGLVEQPQGVSQTPIENPENRAKRSPSAPGERFPSRNMIKSPYEIADLIRRMLLTLDSVGGEFSRTLRGMLVQLGDILGDVYWEHRDDVDAVIANAIVQRAADWQRRELEASYVTMWRSMLVATIRDVNGALGLAINIPDHVADGVLLRGGRRAGLVDLTEQARRDVMRIMADAGANQTPFREVQAQIARDVPAGPWSSSSVRASVISRTEVKYAQNVSSLAAYEASDDIEAVQVIDAQLGPTDEDCERLDGMIVTFAEARRLADSEHPNGTRSFAPVVRPPPDL